MNTNHEARIRNLENMMMELLIMLVSIGLLSKENLKNWEVKVKEDISKRNA
jgi:hypothetical protein